MLIIDFHWKSNMDDDCQTTAWDNISQWEYENSFTLQFQDYKKTYATKICQWGAWGHLFPTQLIR